jgi:glycosyltransferase involved in cell wall biosynthesis
MLFLTPKVSVIVPVYNGERFLGEALQSIVSQNYHPLEVLVVDDGSIDQSAAVAATFPGVRILSKDHSGLAATLNHGIAHATGELFAFLDADDRWLPGKVERQVYALQQKPEMDMVFSHLRQFSMRRDATGDTEEFTPAQPGYSKVTLMIRRSTFMRVGNFTETQGKHDFLDWYARAQSIGLQTDMLPDILVERRIHESNYGRTNPTEQRQRYFTALRASIQQRRSDATATE